MVIPISFIQYEVGASAQVGLAHLEEVDKTSGRCNDDLNPVLKISHLGALRSTSEDTGVLDLRRPSKVSGDFLNLLCQLSGGCQD